MAAFVESLMLAIDFIPCQFGDNTKLILFKIGVDKIFNYLDKNTTMCHKLKRFLLILL